MGIKKFITNNIGLKLIALFLAVITWLYIVAELNKASTEETAALERLLPYRMTAKLLSVQLNIDGKPLEGYRILTDEVTITPSDIMVIGPRSLLHKTSYIKTEPLKISEYTKSFTKDVSLMPLAKGLSIKEKFVTVSVPIQRVK